MNNKDKLLLVTPFFPPSAASGSFRALGFARHLPKFGWNLTVVASGPRPWETNDPDLVTQIPIGTDVHYVDFPLQRARKVWHQVLQRLRIKGCTDVWNAPAFQACLRLVEKNKPDVILTSGPPHNVHLIGRALQARFNLPWVADFRDPWCSWGPETPYVNNRFLLEYVWERSVFRHADAVIANTANTAKMLQEVFPAAAKRIFAVPNGYDPVHLEVNTRGHAASDRFTLLHTGVVYAGRNPRPIVEALRQVSTNGGLGGKPPILRLVGQCLDTALQQSFESQGLLRWVEFADPIPYLDAARALRAADILVLLDSPGRRIGVPAKLYEYVGAGRPVLAIAEDDSDTAQVLESSGLPHRVVSYAQNNSQLYEAINSLAEESQSVGADPNDSQARRFTREVSAQELARVLQSVSSRRERIG